MNIFSTAVSMVMDVKTFRTSDAMSVTCDGMTWTPNYSPGYDPDFHTPG